jgi:putative tricarboxylic transport membrane protein
LEKNCEFQKKSVFCDKNINKPEKRKATMFTHILPYVLAGTLFGFVFGIIPIAGATTALIALYGFLDWFRGDPYTLLAFTTAVVVSCTVGDLFASIVMNIPGGGGSAATMVDGFPLSRQGQAARALSAAVFASCGMGLLWGIVVFLGLPYYTKVVMLFGVPELWAFVMMSLACVCFVNSSYWFRGIIGLCAGIFLGLVGTDPVTNSLRFTGGWMYLGEGIQILPIMAGIMAFPEILEALWFRPQPIPHADNVWTQIKQGMGDTITHWWTAFKGSVVGGIIGLMPGIGGPIVDWLAYSNTVASNKDEDIAFGKGNIKGVIGPEGSVLAQKATAYVPTVLFGIPAAPFEAIIMSLLYGVGLDLGSKRILSDANFFQTLSDSYLTSLALTFLIAIVFIWRAVDINKIPFRYWAVPLLAIITWSCVQYTGGWEDYAMLGLCCVAGFALKTAKISRASFIIGFVMAPRAEALTRQFTGLYEWSDLWSHPIALVLLGIGAVAMTYGVFFNRSKIDYV